MATTSIWRVGGRLGKIIDYAENPEKTTNPSAAHPSVAPDCERDLSDVINYAMQQRKTVKESGDEEQPVMLRFVSGVNCLRHRAPTMAALCRRFQPGRLKFTLRRKPVFPSAQGRVVSPSKRPNVSPLKLLIPQQRKHSGKRKKPPLPPPRKMPTPLLPQAARPRLLQGKPQKPPQSWRNPQRKRQRPCMRQSLPVVLPPHSRRKFLAVLA